MPQTFSFSTIIHSMGLNIKEGLFVHILCIEHFVIGAKLVNLIGQAVSGLRSNLEYSLQLAMVRSILTNENALSGKPCV
jgi:hypothetical protein